MFYYVYILKSTKDGNLYIGYSNNLRRRLVEHNKGKNFSTKFRKPFELIYYEAYRNKEDAEAREQFFKSGRGRRYIKRVMKIFFSEKT